MGLLLQKLPMILTLAFCFCFWFFYVAGFVFCLRQSNDLPFSRSLKRMKLPNFAGIKNTIAKNVSCFATSQFQSLSFIAAVLSPRSKVRVRAAELSPLFSWQQLRSSIILFCRIFRTRSDKLSIKSDKYRHERRPKDSPGFH